jgi:protein JSN1
MYYTNIPLVAERQQNRRWDASKLRELRKRLDSGGMTGEEVDEVAKDFVDGEIVDLASDWLGNTVSKSPSLPGSLPSDKLLGCTKTI